MRGSRSLSLPFYGRGWVVRAGVVLVVFAYLCVAPRLARAEEDLVGILSINTNGVSDATAEQFEEQVEQALQGLGRHSVSRKALRDRLQGSEFLEGCYFGPCLTALRVASGVPLVLVARIQGEGSSYSFVITLVDTKTGMFTAQVAQTCPVCTVDEAIMTATLATIKLLSGGDEMPTASNGTASQGSPTGAADTGQTAERDRSHSGLRTGGWLFLGVGVAAAVVGGYRWQQDDDRDLGIAGLASGAALFTGGATMLLLSQKF